VTKPAKPKSPHSSDTLSFENALAQIEQIIERIESGEVGLEQSLTEYERGVGLINHCRTKLDAARRQVEDLTRKLEGEGGAANESSATDEASPPTEDDPDDAGPRDE
jgi:exodeoxyribonuclease VII small subunit